MQHWARGRSRQWKGPIRGQHYLQVDDERRDFRQPIEGAAAAAGDVALDQILHLGNDADQRSLHVDPADLPGLLRKLTIERTNQNAAFGKGEDQSEQRCLHVDPRLYPVRMEGRKERGGREGRERGEGERGGREGRGESE